MFSPIGFSEFKEDDYRKSLQSKSDEELVRLGKQLRQLSGDGRVVSPTPSTFDQQLRVCREEWRRRHPK
jgi:hypothetical protein